MGGVYINEEQKIIRQIRILLLYSSELVFKGYKEIKIFFERIFLKELICCMKSDIKCVVSVVYRLI